MILQITNLYIEVDGTVVTEENYTASRGSTIVEFKKEFMDKLSVGEHTLTVNWVDGSADTGVTIKANDDNEPKDDIGVGDTFNFGMAAMFIIAAAGRMTILIRKKKLQTKLINLSVRDFFPGRFFL